MEESNPDDDGGDNQDRPRHRVAFPELANQPDQDV
jgi:hypothetical protein